jgi:ribonuclease HI
MDEVVIYADGGCRGNQNKSNIGGWGVLLTYKDTIKELYGSAINTTNNIMELTSAIQALKSIKRHDIPIRVIMDSQYVVDGINKWTYSWVKNNWKTSNKKPVANKELWQELLLLKSYFSDIQFAKCKGHDNCSGNIRADELANIAMDEEINKSNSLISYFPERSEVELVNPPSGQGCNIDISKYVSRFEIKSL